MDDVTAAAAAPAPSPPAAREPADREPAAREPADLPRSLVALLAVGTGTSVAGLYYAQPLLDRIREDLALDPARTGLVVTVTQLGYAASLVLLVPVGDLVERRRLVTATTLLGALALAGVGAAPNAALLFVAAAALGLFSSTGQLLVALSAGLAAPRQRGRVVGTVMSGLLIGILLARAVAGALASLAGWRAVFWTAAAVMVVLAAALRRWLPVSPAPARVRYRALLASVPELLRSEPVLRWRCGYGALSFAGFSALWTPLGLMLAAPPHRLGPAAIGLFGLAGAAGAVAASVAGRLADRGRTRWVTGGCALLLVTTWLPIGLGRHSLVLLVAGILLFDLACQGLHITNQSEIYRLRPQARSRLTAAYMTCYFTGGVLGSALATLAYARSGWSAVAVLGGALACGDLLLWLAEGRLRRRNR